MGTTLAYILRADALSSGQGVERPGLAGPGGAAETLGAVGRVNPAGSPSLQSAGHAAAAAGFPHNLLAVCRHGGAGLQFFLRAGRTADGLRPHQRGGPHRGRHGQGGHRGRQHKTVVNSNHLQDGLLRSVRCDCTFPSKEISQKQPYLCGAGPPPPPH